MNVVSRRSQALGECQVADALRMFAGHATGTAVGFCFRPADARWFRLDAAGTTSGPHGQPFDLTGVFELRAFTSTHELRWRNDDGGRGPAVLVSDDGADTLRPAYERLLWGVVTGSTTDGWVTLADARTGTITVPLDGTPPPAGRRVCLRAIEYEAEDEHGNVAVVDERMTGVGLFHAPRREEDL